ncbi:transmembrane protein 216-like [Antedon mediterranea]|uniref:transmembrane protein 216-like n=1 Tax=Antedon mediterranea TaxID=105859 RepID=UPI003AF7DAF7
MADKTKTKKAAAKACCSPNLHRQQEAQKPKKPKAKKASKPPKKAAAKKSATAVALQHAAVGIYVRIGCIRTQINSSLPLQILLYFNGWYFAFFWICEILIFVFKGNVLPFPGSSLANEIVLLFILLAVETVRICIGTEGNLTEKIPYLGVSVMLYIPVFFVYLYYLKWQTYVLLVEVFLNVIPIIFLALEFIFSVIAMITFARA